MKEFQPRLLQKHNKKRKKMVAVGKHNSGRCYEFISKIRKGKGRALRAKQVVQ